MAFAHEVVMTLGLFTLIMSGIAVAYLGIYALIAATDSTIRFARRLNGLDAKLEQLLREVRSIQGASSYNTIPSAYGPRSVGTVSQYFNPGDWSFGGEPPKKNAARKKRRAA